jgi:DNA transposition AAA+ family ATPase
MASHGYRKVRTVKMFCNNNPNSIYLEDWWVDKASDVMEQDVQDMIQDCLSVAT